MKQGAPYPLDLLANDSLLRERAGYARPFVARGRVAWFAWVPDSTGLYMVTGCPTWREAYDAMAGQVHSIWWGQFTPATVTGCWACQHPRHRAYACPQCPPGRCGANAPAAAEEPM